LLLWPQRRGLACPFSARDDAAGRPRGRALSGAPCGLTTGRADLNSRAAGC